MGQAMLAEALTGEPSEPWSVKDKPWPVYDLFDMPDGSQLFVGIIGDGQWKDFCLEFGREEWLEDPLLQTNNDRSGQRSWLLPDIRDMLTALPTETLIERLEKIGLPFAPVRRPGELLDDPHLLASGGLIDITLPNGVAARAPALPIAFDGERLNPKEGLPAVGGNTRDVLTAYGLSDEEVQRLFGAGTVSDVILTPSDSLRNGDRIAETA
jgi:crotonobetainyl-CoA:carnitine CoA-transferase CaiB-like acyl-CoA transferase